MIERAPKTAREWRSEQRVIKHAGNAALQRPAPDYLETVPGVETANKYELAAYKRHRRFTRVLGTGVNHAVDAPTERQLAMSQGIEHGYLVVGRAIGYATQAYKKFCEEAWRVPDVQELSALLLSDQAFNELVAGLATVPAEVNDRLEHAYGLDEVGFKLAYPSEQPPFAIGQRESGELYIYPREELEDMAHREMPKIEHDKFATCPAHDVLLRPLWEDMITECAVDPDMFAADLGLVMAAE